MNKRLRIAGIIGAIVASVVIFLSPSSAPPLPPPIPEDSENKSVQILAKNLEKPRAIAVSKDRVFVTEKEGRVRVIIDNKLLDDSLATFRTVDVFDGGLLGLALHPNFEENHKIYVYYTYEEDNQMWNKVVQITEQGNKLQDAVTILDKIPAFPFTNGGVMKFGPDNKLYIGTGSSKDTHQAQDIESLAGKILRINDDGAIPKDNPFEGSPVYSLGHRNPRGLAWDDQIMFLVEEGETKNDEINIISAGKNYGWPEQECNGQGDFVAPIVCYDPGIEPGGIAIYKGEKLPYRGQLLMSSLQAANLYFVDYESETQKSILSGLGRIRDVVEGVDGSLYVITSNTDGKGFPAKDDDVLLRILK